MKKILLLFLILIITGCNSSVNNINKVVSDNKNIPIKDEYVDLNPLKLSLYADENSKAKQETLPNELLESKNKNRWKERFLFGKSR